MPGVRALYRPRRGLVKGRGTPSIITSLAPRGLMLCAPLSDPSFMEVTGNFGKPSVVNVPLISTRHGTGISCAGNHEVVSYAYNQGQPPSKWSIEAFIEDVTDTSDGSICGWNQSSDGSNNTQDRRIFSAAPNGWNAELFDGAAKVANAGPFGAGKTLHIIGTTDGATLTCYVHDLTAGAINTASTAVANGGFTGYTSPVYFCVGQSGNTAGGIHTRNSENIILVNFANVCWTAAEVRQRFLNPFGFLSWPEDRRHSLVGIAAAASVPNWGYELDPEFPIRRRARALTLSDDATWPFTAAAAPTQFGWDNPERFAIRRRPQPLQPDQPAEQWPTTASATPAQYGWDNPAQHPKRRRWFVEQQDDPPIPLQLGTLTPTQQGFAWEPQFPIRRRPRMFRDADEQYPRTNTPTPTQFGWNVEPQFAERRKPRFNVAPSDEMWPVTVTATPGPLAWDSPIYRAIRRKFAPFVGDPDLLIATVTPTGQIVVSYAGPVWKRRRSRPPQ